MNKNKMHVGADASVRPTSKARQNKGITLIALIITIIVMLILVAVTINMAINGGLFDYAGKAKIKLEAADEKEGVQFAVVTSMMENVPSLEITKDNLENALKKQVGNNISLSITDNGDGSFTVKFDDTNRMYYVESTGNIIDNDEILKISTKEELKAFRDEVNGGNTFEGKVVFLMNNITLDINEEWEPIGLYPNESSSPDSENNKPFKGILDGQGHEINGLYINNTTDKVQGLFGLVVGGTIKNLGIGSNCSITGNLSTGAMAGYLYNGASAINCYNKSELNVGSNSGGVFGQVAKNCSVENCYNRGNITSNSSYVGGITGNLCLDSRIDNCYNTGEINGKDVIGGITGQMLDNSLVQKCYNTGEISGKDIIGGITGQIYKNSLMQNCYNTGEINGSNKIGGITGQNTSEIYNCYNIGNITGVSTIGGITGQNTKSSTYNTIGTIKNVYSLENACENVCGYNSGVIEQSFIKTSEELKSLSSILGDSFKEDTNNINNGYPILNWQ